MIYSRKIVWLVALVLIVFSACKEDAPAEQKVSLFFESTIDSLHVSISGSASSTVGEIEYINLVWGDGTTGTLTDVDFADFSSSHTYAKSGTYSLRAIAYASNDMSTIYADTVVLFVTTVTPPRVVPKNIDPKLQKKSKDEYLILTLNLHTYQESNQAHKLGVIADFIDTMEVDFIAFQECAQHKNSPVEYGIVKKDNMALLVTNMLNAKNHGDYNMVWDWAHYGWDVWEEGVAVISKHTRLATDQRYISTGTGKSNITSRKAILGSYQTPSGTINIVSAHTHWRTSTSDEEHNTQVKNIKNLASQNESAGAHTWVCGDFNVNPTSDFPWSEGYNTMVAGGEYVDTYLVANPSANAKPARSKYFTVGGTYPGRIDYVFMKANTAYEVVASQIVFTSSVLGKVSDHYGVITKVKKK